MMPTLYSYLVTQYRLSLIRAALRGTGGKVERAAHLLGLQRNALYVVAKRAGLSVAQLRGDR